MQWQRCSFSTTRPGTCRHFNMCLIWYIYIYVQVYVHNAHIWCVYIYLYISMLTWLLFLLNWVTSLGMLFSPLKGMGDWGQLGGHQRKRACAWAATEPCGTRWPGVDHVGPCGTTDVWMLQFGWSDRTLVLIGQNPKNDAVLWVTQGEFGPCPSRACLPHIEATFSDGKKIACLDVTLGSFQVDQTGKVVWTCIANWQHKQCMDNSLSSPLNRNSAFTQDSSDWSSGWLNTILI